MSEADHVVEMVELPFPFVEGDDQKLRCFIAEHYVNPEIDAAILIENMQHIYEWIKDGKLVARARKSGPSLVKT